MQINSSFAIKKKIHVNFYVQWAVHVCSVNNQQLKSKIKKPFSLNISIWTPGQ